MCALDLQSWIELMLPERGSIGNDWLWEWGDEPPWQRRVRSSWPFYIASLWGLNQSTWWINESCWRSSSGIMNTFMLFKNGDGNLIRKGNSTMAAGLSSFLWDVSWDVYFELIFPFVRKLLVYPLAITRTKGCSLIILKRKNVTLTFSYLYNG